MLLAVTSGLRRSELFALKWNNVDFEAKQIHVSPLNRAKSDRCLQVRRCFDLREQN